MRVVLVHAALADARMWDPLIPWLQGHEPVSYDLRGHGQMDEADAGWHHVDDLLGLLGDSPAVVLGSSIGGRVALEAAVLRPDLVRGLVLLAPGLDDWAWSAESEAYAADEERLLDAGDFDGATALNVRFWVVGPERRPAHVPREVRDLATAMQRRAFAVQAALGVEEAPRVDGLLGRLPEVRVPTLVAVGEHDVPDMHAIARAVADAIPGAGHSVIPGAAHLPSLETPERTGRLVARFLRGIGG